MAARRDFSTTGQRQGAYIIFVDYLQRVHAPGRPTLIAGAPSANRSELAKAAKEAKNIRHRPLSRLRLGCAFCSSFP
jgi:hypothetical protein